MDYIWWNKVTNASRFLDLIVESIQMGQSVILQLPENVPWYAAMQEIVSTNIRRQNSTRTCKCIKDTGMDPGEYLFYEYCEKEKRAHYRPGIGYSEFLAKSDDIVLNDYILWICGADREQVEKWYSFIEDYNKVLGRGRQGCTFILETRFDQSIKEKKGIRKINYKKEIVHYDHYLFHMLAVSTLREPEVFKQYLAEVVSSMLPDDIELASLCIASGRAFLNEPVEVIRKIADSDVRRDGKKFVLETTEKRMKEGLWEAQIKVIFPLIEKHRNAIIKKYKSEIENLLPVSTAYGEVIEEVNEVELGIISYLAASGKIRLSYEDGEKVLKLKNARNALAHLDTLAQPEVDAIFDL